MRIICTLAAFALHTCLTGCSPEAERNYTEFGGLTMGSSYSVKLELHAGMPDRAAIRNGIDAVFSRVDNDMSTYKEESELSLINRMSTTQPISVSDDLFSILDLAQDISRETNGSFDITVGPLVNLWGFGPIDRAPASPTPAAIESARARSGYRLLQLDGHARTIRKTRPDLYLDLSGIASGFGVDRVAAYLDSLSVSNYLVEASGEIMARGVNAEGKPWRIGIEKPVADRRQVQCIIQLDNMGMATSGDYRNYFEIDGRRYSHLIDPATGRPVAHALVSVSVLDPSAARADALATGLLVMGPEQGYEHARDRGISAMFIIRAGDGFTEKYSGNFQAVLVDD
jgi:thiamine biosynthesis lipoprotein